MLALPAPVSARSPLPAWLVAGPEPELASRIIQQRRYPMGHELSLMLGTLPADPFSRSLSLSGSYTWHASDHWGWQVLQGTYVMSQATELAASLALLSGVQATALPERPGLRMAVGSHLVLKPFYGKLAAGQGGMLYVEAFLLLGPGLYGLRRLDGSDAVATGGDWAAGARLHLGDVISLRGQVGQSVFLLQAHPYQALRVELGVAWNFGGDA